MREKFPKLGRYLRYMNFHNENSICHHFFLLLIDFCIYHSKPSRLPGSAGGMGDWPMVPHNIYEYASVGKW